MSLANIVVCKCTSKHIPKPILFFTIELDDEVISLCPTSATNLEYLLLEYKRNKGEVPSSVLKHYSSYIRSLALKKTSW